MVIDTIMNREEWVPDSRRLWLLRAAKKMGHTNVGLIGADIEHSTAVHQGIYQHAE